METRASDFKVELRRKSIKQLSTVRLPLERILVKCENLTAIDANLPGLITHFKELGPLEFVNQLSQSGFFRKILGFINQERKQGDLTGLKATEFLIFLLFWESERGPEHCKAIDEGLIEIIVSMALTVTEPEELMVFSQYLRQRIVNSSLSENFWGESWPKLADRIFKELRQRQLSPKVQSELISMLVAAWRYHTPTEPADAYETLDMAEELVDEASRKPKKKIFELMSAVWHRTDLNWLKRYTKSPVHSFFLQEFFCRKSSSLRKPLSSLASFLERGFESAEFEETVLLSLPPLNRLIERLIEIDYSGQSTEELSHTLCALMRLQTPWDEEESMTLLVDQHCARICAGESLVPALEVLCTYFEYAESEATEKFISSNQLLVEAVVDVIASRQEAPAALAIAAIDAILEAGEREGSGLGFIVEKVRVRAQSDVSVGEALRHYAMSQEFPLEVSECAGEVRKLLNL